MSRFSHFSLVAVTFIFVGCSGAASDKRPQSDPAKDGGSSLSFPRVAMNDPPPKFSANAVPAAATLEVCLDDLAGQVVKNLRSTSKTKIAVVEFSDLDGNVSALGQFIAEELITRLYRTNSFEVVERHLLNKVMAEHALSLSGLVDGPSAQKLGRILGVEAIATGSITDLGASLKLNARLISTETGTIFAVASTALPKDDSVAGLLAKPIATGKVGATTQADAARNPPVSMPESELIPGLRAEYFNLAPNSTMVPTTKPIFTKVDGTVNFVWDFGSPVPRVNADWFAARWTGFIKIEEAGDYSFRAGHDDGLRLWIGGRKIYDRWGVSGWNTVDIKIDETGWLPFRAEYFEAIERAFCFLQWAKPGAANFEVIDGAEFRHESGKQ
jgi:TolB-like protein